VDSILPSYRDPLFSIFIIVILSLIIAVMTFIWGLYRQYKEKSHLHKFLEKFDNNECLLDTSNMPFEITMLKPLTLLANAFDKSGQYHKAINIYLYLIKHATNPIDNTDLMKQLAQTYMHAGFLERSRVIYIQILRTQPRDIDLLYRLGVVYEMTKEYHKALETIEPLKTLGEDTASLERFLHFQIIASDKNSPIESKIGQLQSTLHSDPLLYRPVLVQIFKHNYHQAWQLIDFQRLEEILDILWYLPYAQLDLDIISRNENLQAIYYAKGYLCQKPQLCSIFAIDLLLSSRASGYSQGDLSFTYLCKKCKQNSPISFIRCPHCLAINRIEVEVEIVQQSTQTDYSLL
jgi:lipopolysaccharide assembly protein B